MRSVHRIATLASIGLLVAAAAAGFGQRGLAANAQADAVARIVAAAQGVLTTLDEAGRAKVQFPFGGPQKSLYFYVLNLYEKSFVHLNIGVGSAMAWLFFLIVAVITALNFWARRYWWKQEVA